jgi:uncharacterized protein YjdB
MIKLNFLNFALLALLIAILFSTCCKGDGITNLKLYESNLFLRIGETAELIVIMQPNNASKQNINRTSSNEDIATVNTDVVTANTVGTEIITATTENGKDTASCSVLISFPILRIVQLCDPQLGFGGFNNDVQMEL